MEENKDIEPEKIDLDKIPPFLLKIKFNPNLDPSMVEDELKEDIDKIKRAIKESPHHNK